jgi:hypothetical protein
MTEENNEKDVKQEGKAAVILMNDRQDKLVKITKIRYDLPNKSAAILLLIDKFSETEEGQLLLSVVGENNGTQ